MERKTSRERERYKEREGDREIGGRDILIYIYSERRETGSERDRRDNKQRGRQGERKAEVLFDKPALRQPTTVCPSQNCCPACPKLASSLRRDCPRTL